MESIAKPATAKLLYLDMHMWRIGLKPDAFTQVEEYGKVKLKSSIVWKDYGTPASPHGL